MMSDDEQLTDLIAFDREHLWHPYSSALTPSAPYLVESASGVRLRLRRHNGQVISVIDAMSSWWCAVHGYAVPSLDQAARDQLGRISHVMFGGLTHEPAIALGRKLIELAPRLDGQDESPLQHVFLADSGSVSVEVALKMAWQFHVNPARPRPKMFTIRGGCHGDTFAPMSICDPVGGMHSLFTGVLPEQIFAPRPPAGITVSADDGIRAGSVAAAHPGQGVCGWLARVRTVTELRASTAACSAWISAGSVGFSRHVVAAPTRARVARPRRRDALSGEACVALRHQVADRPASAAALSTAWASMMRRVPSRVAARVPVWIRDRTPEADSPRRRAACATVYDALVVTGAPGPGRRPTTRSGRHRSRPALRPTTATPWAHAALRRARLDPLWHGCLMSVQCWVGLAGGPGGRR